MAERAPTAVFRLEFGGETGWGHLARCAALAAELHARGEACALWTGGDLARAPRDLRAPFSVVRPAAGAEADHLPPEVRAARWLVVDHYGADDAQLRRWRDALAGAGVRILAIDDEARRRLDAADLILNARLGLERSPYAPGVPAMLGESFALLRTGLRSPSQISELPPTRASARALIMLGGSDPRALTPVVLEALAEADPTIGPILVAAKAHPKADAIRRALARFPAAVWIEAIDAAALAGWAQRASFAISAAGGTLYELAFLRLPFVGLVVADNQREFAREVRRRWRMPVLESDGDLRPEELARAIVELRAELAHDSTREALVSGFDSVDGLGAARVAERMLGV